MRFSPGRGKKSPQNKKHKGATSKDTPKTKAGTSKVGAKPPIHLIPTASKKKPNFLPLPHQDP